MAKKYRGQQKEVIIIRQYYKNVNPLEEKNMIFRDKKSGRSCLFFFFLKRTALCTPEISGVYWQHNVVICY